MSDTKVGLITGASRGLGRALARELAGRGWALVLDARGVEGLDAIAGELGARTEVVAVAGDVADGRHRQALASAVRRLGGLDLLVNNASVPGARPQPTLAHYPLAQFAPGIDGKLVAPPGLLP